MATKHEQILQYIANLAVGTKISVRTIAKQQQVSEGTAYRAIKEAENTGLVSTIERVGTIRIEQKPINNIDSLTLKALLKLIDATLGLRVPSTVERQGLDITQHGEEGYIFL